MVVDERNKGREKERGRVSEVVSRESMIMMKCINGIYAQRFHVPHNALLNNEKLEEDNRISLQLAQAR